MERSKEKRGCGTERGREGESVRNRRIRVGERDKMRDGREGKD